MIAMRTECKGEATIAIELKMAGDTDTLLDELAAGMAHAIVQIADDLPALDGIHESLARVTASRMLALVREELDARDRPTEA